MSPDSAQLDRVQLPVCLVICALFMLSSCARLNSIYRSTELHSEGVSGQLVTVDAKQRHLLAVKSSRAVTKGDSTAQDYLRICAEAAPDAFSAYAASMAANLALQERQGALSLGAAETAATIERTQTVNVLRELMYRTCERFMSGGMTKEQLIVQAARDQHIILSVLAIEQLTGTVRAKPTIISGPATAAAMIDGDTAAELIKRYSDEEEAAKVAAATAEKSLLDADKSGKCVNNTSKPADVTAEHWSACEAAKAALAGKKTELKTASDRLEKVLTLSSDLVRKSNAATTAGTNSGDALISKPSDAAIAAVGQAVQAIVLYSGIDEALMFCIAQLSGSTAMTEKLVDACADVVANNANRHEAIQDLFFETSDIVIGAYEIGGKFKAKYVPEFAVAVDDADRVGKLGTAAAAFDAATAEHRGVLSLVSDCVSADACKKAIERWGMLFLKWPTVMNNALVQFRAAAK